MRTNDIPVQRQAYVRSKEELVIIVFVLSGMEQLQLLLIGGLDREF
jgi:hypothetical protein